MSVDLDERVHELVAAHRPQLEQLVRQAVDRELERLVEAELQSRNGATTQATTGERSGAATKRCTRCGEVKPATAFEKHRTQCRACRARAREHAPAGGEAPRGGPAASGDQL